MTDQTKYQEDMSMEEILSSIRKYVNDDPNLTPVFDEIDDHVRQEDDSAPQAIPNANVTNPPRKESQTNLGQSQSASRAPHITLTDAMAVQKATIVNHQTESNSDSTVSSSTVKASNASVSEAISESMTKQADVTPAPSAHAATSPSQGTQQATTADNNYAIGTPFTKLKQASENTSAQGSQETLQQFLAELAKPMIQTWLDTNLERIVEAKVDEAIARMQASH